MVRPQQPGHADAWSGSCPAQDAVTAWTSRAAQAPESLALTPPALKHRAAINDDAASAQLRAVTTVSNSSSPLLSPAQLPSS
eukprot:CAMPEP_0181205794 /NCGR_PEP_ID=MMETSP1096-20121128/20671_1 /TAXON_ID=156174 ORGANISM="Chrysochromulina ericina, Strain CCMP281" /NCGR_SAMPLE_ID=MMETSP1096 /ASSEMBLY_ACC=CAM_ASM_000453 /LENGTH=81 /DNA_ID=CAMNT_0023296609 /DNA_START=482 /DNA_END=724 /DNA_ORIENTATION=+